MPKQKCLSQIILLVTIAIFFSGCAVKNALFDETGLSYKDYDLKIPTENKTTALFINENWRVGNWALDNISKKWKRKTGPEYKGYVFEDLNDDGNEQTIKNFYSDLELVNKKNDARIIVDTRPIPKSKADTNMEVFLSNFAENTSGSVSWLTSHGYTDASVRERTYATKIISSKTFEIKTHDAVVAIIEQADLNQLKLDPNHRSRMIAVLLVRIDDFKKVKEYRGRMSWYEVYPGILVIVLRTKPQYFDKLQNDFYYFVNGIKLNGTSTNVPRLSLGD